MEESASPNITTKQFSILSDHMPIYNFLLDAFSQNRRGVPAPFWEYALCSSWIGAASGKTGRKSWASAFMKTR